MTTKTLVSITRSIAKLDFSENLETLAYKVLALFMNDLPLHSAHILQIINGRVANHLFVPSDADFLPYNSNLFQAPFLKEKVDYVKYNNYHVYYFSFDDFGLCVFVAKERLLDEEQKVIEYLIFLLDNVFRTLSEKQTLENTLKNRQNLFQSIIDAIPDLIAYKDLEERYVFANTAAKKHYRSNIIGKTIAELYPPDEASVVRKLDLEVLKEKKSNRQTIPVYTSFGYLRADSIRSPVFDNEKKLQGIVSIARDISELEKTKENLESNFAFQNILVRLATKYINVPASKKEDSINEILSLSGEFIDADRSFVFLYHFDEGLIEYRYEWCKPGVSPEIDKLKLLELDDYITGWVEKHKIGESVFIPDIEQLSADDPVYQTLQMQGIKSVIAIPLMDHQQCLGFVGFDDVKDTRIWDQRERNLMSILAEIITNLLVSMKTDQALISAKDIAERANREKSDFLANISHDIRTPLNGVFNAVYLLNQSQPSLEQKGYLDIAESSIQTLNTLISNVIDITKIESGQFELDVSEFNLEELVYDIIRSQMPSVLKKNLQFVYTFDYRIERKVRFDASKLNHLLINLINNAVKFTTEGKIEVSVTLTQNTEHHGQLQFTVRDTGIGIKSDEIGRITEKFYRSKEKLLNEKGTGLGLSIVHLMLKNMDSELVVESDLENGSSFSFSLALPWGEKSTTYESIANENVLIVSLGHTVPDELIHGLNSLAVNLTLSKMLPKNHQSYRVIFWIIDFDLSDNLIKYHTYISKKPLSQMAIIYDAFSTISFHRFNDLGGNYLSKAPFLRTVFFRKWREWNDGLVEKSFLVDERESASVLLIEDNPVNRETLNDILTRKGWAVSPVKSAEEALYKLKSQSFDIILLDIQLPMMQGDEFAEMVRQNQTSYQNIPLIAVTAHALKEDIQGYLSKGINDVLTKPIDIQLLLDAMNRLVHPENELSLAIADDLSVFSQERFESTFKGFSDIGLRMMGRFIETSESHLGRLNETLRSCNAKDIHRAIHDYKGMLSYLGAERLISLLAEILSSLDTIETNDYQFTLYRLIEKETLRFIDEISVYYKENNHG